MDTSVCKKCKVTKPLDQFNKILRRGPLEEWNLEQCKSCASTKAVGAFVEPNGQKKCKKCGRIKPFADFTKQIAEGPLEDYNLRQCKECVHAEFVARYADPEKRDAMQDASNNWKKQHPEDHARLAREYRVRNKEKTKAQNQLNYAIRKGRIIRQPCERCSTTDRVHAHHVTYEPKDWYNVKWLCFRCHKLEHLAK